MMRFLILLPRLSTKSTVPLYQCTMKWLWYEIGSPSSSKAFQSFVFSAL